MGRVFAAAEHLKTEGKYSDGIGRTERVYVAGHSVWRLSDEFVNAPQIVGNDEQYAATMALIANDIGVPARVVLGAEVPEGGRVTGKDVSAWVELRAADGSWRTLPTESFMSTTPPADQIPETNTPMSGTVIPPPNPIPPPSDAGEQSDADLKERKATRKKREAEDEGLIPGAPGWLGVAVTYVGGPLLLLALLLGAIVGLKVWRRHRRRSADSPSARFVGAWRELVDHARDLGQVVPLGPTVTRREQSVGIVSDQAPSLARRADSFVFGPRAPETAAAATYWESIDAERRAMSHGVGRRQRLLAAISLRSLRPGRPTAAQGRAGAGGCRGPRGDLRRAVRPAASPLIGVHARHRTKLALRPNVGCVSWRLAAARTSSDLIATDRRAPGKRCPEPPHEVHRSPACRSRAVPGPR